MVHLETTIKLVEFANGSVILTKLSAHGPRRVKFKRKNFPNCGCISFGRLLEILQNPTDPIKLLRWMVVL